MTVRAEDDEGLFDTRDLVVTVTGVNEPPVLDGPASAPYDEDRRDRVATYTATDPERNTVAWSVLGTDRDDFTITDGVLAFKTPPNHEEQAAYAVTVRASDGIHHAERDVDITIGDVDEGGTLTFSSPQPLTGIPLTATLTDLDGSISGESWKWERSSNRSDWTTIASATSGSYLPGDDDLDQYLRVTAEYTDGHGSGKSKQVTSANRVQAPPPDNEVPTFSAPTMERTVPENSAADARVGAAVQASDNPGDDLTYSLPSHSEGLFTIDSRTGQIRVAEGAVLNHEDDDSHSVTVEASDPLTATARTLVTIRVDNVNERPTAVPDTKATVEDTATTIDVLRNDDDPDADDTRDTLTVALQRFPGKGSAALNADSTITYTPKNPLSK